MTATSCCLLIGVVLAYNQLRRSDYMETKDILKEIRTKNNLTQEELGKKLNITKAWTCRLENDRVKTSKIMEMKIKMLEKEV